MENNALSRIISVEKEIQERLETEKTRAAEWLEEEKRALEQKLLGEEEKIKEESGKRLEEAIRDAEARAAALLAKAHTEAAGLTDLDEEHLKRVVMKYIVRVLPGGAA